MFSPGWIHSSISFLLLLQLSSSFFFPSILPTLPISLTTRSDDAFKITNQAVKTHEGGQRFCRLYHKYTRISPRSVSVEIFAQWNVRYSEVFDCKMTNVTVAEKILLQQRFSSVNRARFFTFLLPQKPSYLPFSNTAQLTTRPSLMTGYHVSLLRNDMIQTSSSKNYAQSFGIALSRNNGFDVWFSFLICSSKYPPRYVSHFWLGWIEIQT